MFRCGKSGVRIGGSAFRFADVVLADNSIELTTLAAVALTAVGLTEVDIVDNTIGVEKGDGIVCGGGPARISGNEIVSRERDGERGIRLVAASIKAELPTFQISGNRLSGLRTHGISIETRVASAQITQNVLRGLPGNGIVMSEGGVAEYLGVVGNELIDIATATTVATRARPLAAIHLARVIEGIVSENMITGVGREAALAAVIVGIRVDGSRDVRVTDNTVTNIGPVANFSNLAAGILVQGPLVTLAISDNLIRRQITFVDIDNSNWQAIRVNGLASAGASKQPFTNFSTFTTAQRIHLINSFAAAAQTAKEDASVTANALHAFGGGAVAEIFINGSCRFSDNHCTAGTRPIPAAVNVTATSIVAASNRVECERETHGLDLKVAVKNAVTVIGNITNGPIFVNGSTLSTPWQPLNVLP
jgi:hypothetical protein